MVEKQKFVNYGGLSEQEAGESANHFGRNKFTKFKRKSFFSSLLGNFGDPMIRVLLIALSINAVFLFGRSNWYESAGIAVAVLIAVVVSTISEYSGESAFEKLQESSKNITCRVVREGKIKEILVEDVVVGDLVLLSSGEKIPADGMIVGGSLDVDQSSLNGESKECHKECDSAKIKSWKDLQKILSAQKSATSSPKSVIPSPKSAISSPKSTQISAQSSPKSTQISAQSNQKSEQKSSQTSVDFNSKTLLFSGTVANGGEAQMVVTSVGDNTFYGKIAKEIQEQTPDSPLKIKLTKLAKKISFFGYFGAFLVGFSYLFNAIVIKNSFNGVLILRSINDFHSLITHILNAVTLAVTVIVLAVPEGLPMMITVVLSANMRRMLKDNVLIRRLNGIETAGSLNILFTDKTGTLTNGKLDVVSIVDGNGKIHTPIEFAKQNKLKDILKLSLEYNTCTQMVENRAVGGNATDRALTEFSYRFATSNLKANKIKTIPFDSKNKFMATQISGFNLCQMSNFTLVKGAPERILDACNTCFSQNGTVVQIQNRDQIIKSISDLSYKAMRIIAVAISPNLIENQPNLIKNQSNLIENQQNLIGNQQNLIGNHPNFANPNAQIGQNNDQISQNNALFDQKNMILVGLIGIQDQIRPEASKGVSEVTRAGIQTVMITGDSKATAMAVARQTGIIFAQSDLVLTSDEMAKLSDDQLKSKLKDLRVVARALPNDKSRLVRIAQSLNLVVGMTGDGVNDAPALKKADIGFAMGSGTEVAKESADAVILDDNILSISKAVCYGRTVFKSIRKFVVFQLTINLCAMAISVIAPFLNIQMPITVIQMLWINLVMDTLAGVAFGGERPRAKYMNELPKRRDEPIINSYMWQQIALMSVYMSVISIVFLKSRWINAFFSGSNANYFMTAFFALFMFLAIFNSFNARTHELNLVDYLALNKPFIWIIGSTALMQILLTFVGGAIFRTTPLSLGHLAIILAIAFSVIPLDLLRKLLTRRFGFNSGT